MSNQNISIHNLSFMIILFFSFFCFLLFPTLKLFNSSSTFFDLIIFIKKFEYININNLFKGHNEIHVIIFKYLSKIVSQEYKGYLVITLQSIIVFFPIFLIKEKIIKIIYILNPFLWNLILFDVHTEMYLFFLLPLIYGCLLKKNYKFVYLLLIILVITKETFLPLAFFLVLLKRNFFYKDNLDYIFLILFLFYGLFLIYFDNLNNNNYLLSLGKIYSYPTYLKLILFYGIQIAYFFILKKNKIFFLIFYLIPVNFLFIIFGISLYSNILTHHYLYLVLPIFFHIIFIEKERIKSLFILNLIILLTISSFPFSILSLSKLYPSNSIDNYYIDQNDINFNKYLKNNFEFLNKHKIIVDNNVINNYLASYSNVSPFPILESYDDSIITFKEELYKKPNEYIFVQKLNKSRFFIIDYQVSENTYKNYFEKLNFLKKEIIFKNEKFMIFKFVIE